MAQQVKNHSPIQFLINLVTTQKNLCLDSLEHLLPPYPLLQLSCTSTYILELEVIIVSGINIILPSLTIFVSDGLILSNILHISSTEGRSKAFRTCSSHIIAVSLFFGSSAFVYLKPSSMPMNKGKVLSVFYTNVVPMMNTLIYSLRNKDVKLALRKTLRMGKFWSEIMSMHIVTGQGDSVWLIAFSFSLIPIYFFS